VSKPNANRDPTLLAFAALSVGVGKGSRANSGRGSGLDMKGTVLSSQKLGVMRGRRGAVW
jgi:hypothetical protein